MRTHLTTVRTVPVVRAYSFMGAALLAGCICFSACNHFADPDSDGGVHNFNPGPEGVYFFSRVWTGSFVGYGTSCNLEVVRRPLPANPDESGNQAQFQDESRGSCVTGSQGLMDSTYAYSRMDTAFFHEAAGNLVMDSVDHFFESSAHSMSFPQSVFRNSGSGTWEDCVYSGAGRTIPCKRFRFSGGLDPVEADTLVFLRDFGLLFYSHQEQFMFHGVSSLTRIHLNRIIRGQDTLDFDGTVSP